MSLEIEAKMAVDDVEVLRRRLAALGACHVGRTQETNIFFDDDAGSLQASDRGLRIRINEHEPVEGERTAPRADTSYRTTTVTYKGPREGGELKRREEIEFHVDDADAAAALFEALGYRRTLSFDKHRETFTWRDCEIVLDHLPYLGHFIEIEGPDNTSVMEARRALGLEESPLLTSSYIAMLASFLHEHDIRAEHISLDAATSAR